MTAGLRRPGKLRTKLVLLIAVPLAALVSGKIAGRLVAERQPIAIEEALRREAERLRLDSERLLEEASRVAESGLAGSSQQAARQLASRGLASRLEGLGRLGPDNAYLEWEGTPIEPPAPASPHEGRTWSVHVQGLWTRLLARSGPDAAGRHGLACFLLDSPFPELQFAELLPRVGSGAVLHVDFVDAEQPDEDLVDFFGRTSGVLRAGSPAAFYHPLTSPAGDVLAVAMLQEVPAAQRASLRESWGRVTAALLAVLLLAALFDWPVVCRSGTGVLAAIAAIAAGRVMFLLGRVPAMLLPREIGSPTLYGSPEAAGLLGSPADLLASALGVFLVALALEVYLEAVRHRSFAALASVAAATAATTCLLGVAFCLARDARIPLLRFQGTTHASGRAVLLVALAFAILAAAELSSLAFGLFRGTRQGARRPVTAAAALALTALSSLALLSTSDGLAFDRLRSEFAPQVLEQAARRRGALAASVREAGISDRAADAVTSPQEAPDSYATYLLWASGDLFLSGYQSSLDLYDAAGIRRSTFGFNLPPLDEKPAALAASDPGPIVRDEVFPEGALQVKVIHAESSIVHQGVAVGTVVGHVLDEPENLPFLPWSAPYLAALGPGAPRVAKEDPSGAPDYALYASDGSVVLSTLNQPPAPSASMREAARTGQTLRVEVADQPYVGLALADPSRLHLLLLPAPTLLGHLSACVRVGLVVLLLLVLIELLRLGSRPAAFATLARAVRGSFYRKVFGALLVASVIPVLGLSLFSRGYIERRIQAARIQSAARLVSVVKNVVEDYAAAEASDEPGGAIVQMDDEILHWLRRVVGQEIHVYEHGLVVATSKRELFASGLLPRRLPGEVQRRLVQGGLPFLVLESRLGPGTIPVAYARARLLGPAREAVVAVPLILQQQQTARAIERVSEMLLLATVLLLGLVASTAAVLARTVARPVRELVEATHRIAKGDYGARLLPRTRDELAELVNEFNAMAAALAAQRADLERRRDYMEALLRNATTGVVSTDARGRIVTLNPMAGRLLSGATGAPGIGEDLVAAVGLNPELARLAAALTREPSPEGEPEEVDLERPGEPRRLRLVRVGLPDPMGGQPGWLLLLDDVTDLMRSNQLAAWAEMARAIAHEIKNPLTPIQLSTEHLERLLRDRNVLPSPEVEACLETVANQVRSLRAIAAEFSAYAKLPALAREPTDPVALIREIAAPYRAGSPPGISIEERYEAVPQIVVDRRVIGRAIVNLVENALDAMAGRGTLALSVTREASDGAVVLSVGDTGPGLAPEVRARLFEPYFSTKSAGTGLGLAIVRRAVEAHQGRVEVESEAGRGTIFRIHLPAA